LNWIGFIGIRRTIFFVYKSGGQSKQDLGELVKGEKTMKVLKIHDQYLSV